MEAREVPAKEPADAKSDEIRSANRNRALKLFAGAVIDMSWQLALVVLVPLVGGFELDKHFHIFPALTITGAVIAVVGYFLIVRRMYKQYSNRSIDSSIPKGGAK
ncbi:hypothetical protein M1512_02450 [Patescibacteria group bacterium]|nr:hypothetical protein [Patescibacteria group bacterium]